jgi:hypothetical protein
MIRSHIKVVFTPWCYGTRTESELYGTFFTFDAGLWGAILQDSVKAEGIGSQLIFTNDL